MSGFLRHTKRARAADTGEISADGPGAGPEDARTAETSAGDASSAKTIQLPAGAAETGTGPATAAGSDAALGVNPAATRPGATPAETPSGAATPPAQSHGNSEADVLIAQPVVQAGPGTPAGLDPAEAGAQVVTGRRGRLRRRLRYLRRARELMLRDLGGLLYEVHRSGGGDVGAHAATIGAKVERLTALDAETTAIERTLGAVRGQAVVFEPGIGGTCEICGELYGSSARFCSSCGSSAGATAQAPAPPAQRPPAPAMPKPPAPAADGAPQDGSARPNGRTEPELSADDPLAARRSGS